jgi:NAD(P)-dependent dehydrogenase (short-subunit alcohol dehydrogenase family)
LAGGIAAAGLLRGLLRRSRWFSYEGKGVVVTGGSRGLGLALARELVHRGAHVIVCARGEEELAGAERQLSRLGGHAGVLYCNVQNPRSVKEMAAEAEARLGRVDVLINNAGIIQVGPLDAMTFADFQQAMAVHCWGALHTTRAVLPGMRRRRWGRIVNIASIGAKLAVPHLLPYTVSKFALAGLSEGLRVELAKEEIFVTTVCPGLMRTGSTLNALFKSRYTQEYAWFSTSGSLPVLSLDVQRAARQILRACQRGDPEAVIGAPAKAAAALRGLAPGLMLELAALADRLLPRYGGIETRARRGYQSRGPAPASWLARRSGAAALKNNEITGTYPNTRQPDAE